ncbi:hypothetical protein GA0115243_1044207 [Streptomyces sp. ScaeMP-e83]|nr:hypothetical protein GA0115243_1044207 [Streptomyces sp. ScaeMP-e83]
MRAGRLPALHRDFLDRILIAQAQIEGMAVVTRDKWIPQYEVPVMAVRAAWRECGACSHRTPAGPGAQRADAP